MKTNASIFEDMGNPWAIASDFEQHRIVLESLTPRHRQLVMINNRLAVKLAKAGIVLPPSSPLKRAVSETVSIGDPELDQFTKASMAPRRKVMPSEPRPVTVMDTRRKMAVTLAKMHRQILLADPARALLRIKPGKPIVAAPVFGKVQKAQKGYYVWIKSVDGSEEDREYFAPRLAEAAFKRQTRLPDAVEVELWSNVTGELLLSWHQAPTEKRARK